MMRVLVDVNVILDVLLDRAPHVAGSAAVWSAIETGTAEGLLPAHAVTTIHYLIQKERGAAKARRTLNAMLRVFHVAMVDESVIHEALQLPCPDFEDAVTASAAQAAHCELVITRDFKGFRGSPVRILAPEAALPLLHT
jgi:predicted nucleic acid-binding protein